MGGQIIMIDQSKTGLAWLGLVGTLSK